MASAEQQDPKRKMHRSPAYPSLGLKVALGHAKTIYKEEKRTAAPVAVVASHCGADIKSSKGLRLIAALKQFGLVVEEGSGDDRKVKLSDRALDIELADSDEQRNVAIQAAALAPPIHAKIWEHYGGNLPSEPTLKSYLLRTINFNDAYVDRFIKQFRSTLAFAKLTSDDIIDDDEGDDDDPDGGSKSKDKAVSAVVSTKTEKAVIRDFPIPLSGGGLAVVKVPVPMSLVDFEQITGTLKAWKAMLVSAPAKSSDDADDPADDE